MLEERAAPEALQRGVTRLGFLPTLPRIDPANFLTQVPAQARRREEGTEKNMRKLSAIRADIVAQWPSIVSAARVRPEALEALPQSPSLLGSGTKTEKGEGRGYLTAVVYMSPAREAFAPGDSRTLCPRATEACAAACLGSKAGRMVMAPVKASRLWKATLYLGARTLWRELAEAEIASFQGTAERAGLRPVVRIDGSTDTGEGARFVERFPGVTFYDYSKVEARALKHATDATYRVTFSYSGRNLEGARSVLAAGGNVAVVFSTSKGEALPSHWQGAPVIDGDETDLRFLDPIGGYVVGLRFKQAKGRKAALAAALAEGFAVQA